MWRIRQGYQLLDRRGELVAGSGEVVAADHPAVLACPDLSRIAYPVDPDAPAPVVAAVEEPQRDAPVEPEVTLDPAKLAAFGRKPKGSKG